MDREPTAARIEETVMRELTLLELEQINGGRTEMLVRILNSDCEEYSSCPDDPSDKVPCFTFTRCRI
jgi:hypothetical protein